MRTISLTCASSSGVKTMNSSMRLTNSGLKWRRTMSITASLTSRWEAPALSASRMAPEPRLDVMMMIEFLNDTMRPWGRREGGGEGEGSAEGGVRMRAD